MNLILLQTLIIGVLSQTRVNKPTPTPGVTPSNNPTEARGLSSAAFASLMICIILLILVFLSLYFHNKTRRENFVRFVKDLYAKLTKKLKPVSATEAGSATKNNQDERQSDFNTIRSHNGVPYMIQNVDPMPSSESAKDSSSANVLNEILDNDRRASTRKPSNATENSDRSKSGKPRKNSKNLPPPPPKDAVVVDMTSPKLVSIGGKPGMSNKRKTVFIPAPANIKEKRESIQSFHSDSPTDDSSRIVSIQSVDIDPYWMPPPPAAELPPPPIPTEDISNSPRKGPPEQTKSPRSPHAAQVKMESNRKSRMFSPQEAKGIRESMAYGGALDLYMDENRQSRALSVLPSRDSLKPPPRSNRKSMMPPKRGSNVLSLSAYQADFEDDDDDDDEETGYDHHQPVAPVRSSQLRKSMVPPKRPSISSQVIAEQKRKTSVPFSHKTKDSPPLGASTASESSGSSVRQSERYSFGLSEELQNIISKL